MHKSFGIPPSLSKLVGSHREPRRSLSLHPRYTDVFIRNLCWRVQLSRPRPPAFRKTILKKRTEEGNEPAPLIPREYLAIDRCPPYAFSSRTSGDWDRCTDKKNGKERKNNTKISRDISFEISSHHCCLYGGEPD